MVRGCDGLVGAGAVGRGAAWLKGGLAGQEKSIYGKPSIGGEFSDEFIDWMGANCRTEVS